MELIESYLTNNPCYQANVKRQDSRYTVFQNAGPKGLMLHSVGCAQPKAEVFCKGWNRTDYDRACVHAFIDADTGVVWQTLPWNFRGWHCGGSGNNSHLGVEMCESAAIRYLGANRFEILDRKTALADCRRTYKAAAELFARLCLTYGLDPKTAVRSHKEGAAAGMASDHGDPEHYWLGLDAGYTMDSFRADVAKAMKTALPFPKPGAGSASSAASSASSSSASSSSSSSASSPSSSASASASASAPRPADPALPYTDVDPNDWYADALRWAVEKRIFGPGTYFRPEAPCTRALAVVLLRRMYLALRD